MFTNIYIAWSGDPCCRPTFQKIVLDLNNLITIEREKSRFDNSSWFRCCKDFEIKVPPISKADQSSVTLETKKLQNTPTILAGIAQHEKGNREKALEIFTEHTKLDNKTANFGMDIICWKVMQI